MQLSSIRALPNLPPARATRSAAPEAVEPQSADTVQIGTLEEAARLPVLDPAFQMGLAVGVLSSLMGGPREVPPKVQLDVASHQGDVAVSAHYNLDLSAATPLTGSGQIGDQTFTETGRLQDGKILFEGQVGQAQEALEIEIGEDERSFHISGNAGALPVDLDVQTIRNGEGAFTGISTVGLVGGQRYMVDALIDLPGSVIAGENSGAMTVRGHMNGELVHKNYRVSVRSNEDGLLVQADGQGLNAGVFQAVDVRLRVSA
ncbi:MAG: hypothetical protein AB7S38_09540 [Vulcanimicrobiota bacterium]